MAKYSARKDGQKKLSKSIPSIKVIEAQSTDWADAIFVTKKSVSLIVDIYNTVPLFKSQIKDFKRVKSITINRWYSTVKRNNQIGGAKDSRHLKGDAVDYTIKYEDTKGKIRIVPSSITMCCQQIVGAKGNEQISPTSAHVDGRTNLWNAKKKGNSYPKLPDDLFKYFGHKRPKVKFNKKKIIRSTYASKGKKLKTIKKGTAMSVIDCHKNGAGNIWVKVNINGVKGWVYYGKAV